MFTNGQKIKVKLTIDGITSYVRLGDFIAFNNGREDNAAIFELEKRDSLIHEAGLKNAFYLKCTKSKGKYLDQTTSNGSVFITEPIFKADYSSIYAWELKGDRMSAVALLDPTFIQKLSKFSDGDKDNLLFCLLKDNKPYDVEWEIQ